MNGPDSINALVVAERILGKPSRFRVTDNEVLALCGCLVGLNEQLDAIDDKPVLKAKMAAAIASFIEIERVFVEEVRAEVFASDEIFHRRERAFNTLKTTFDMEFPQ